MIFEPQTCYSKLICALERLFRRVQVRDACFPNLNFASLLCLATARRKLLPLIRIADDALTGPSCSRATCSIRGRCARCCPHFLGCLAACAIGSHVTVAILVVVYERGEVAGRSRVESFCATRDLESNLRLYTR